MAKYSVEFKLKIVQEYLKGDIGYRALAHKYGIPDKKTYSILGCKISGNGGKRTSTVKKK